MVTENVFNFVAGAGSVIDAMSEAVEGAELMLYGVSAQYKESANCRLELSCECENHALILAAIGLTMRFITRRRYARRCGDDTPDDAARLQSQVSGSP